MRRFLLGLGLFVVTVAAVVASVSTLASLAQFTGWGEKSSWLLPASLDALGMTACLVWLDGTASAKSRRYAAWLTWTAAALSILGNGAGHLATTGHLSQGLLLVVLVGAVPPAALATTVHLIVLVSSPSSEVEVRDAAPVPAAKPQPDLAPSFLQAAPNLGAGAPVDLPQSTAPSQPSPVPAKKAAPKPVLAKSGPDSGRPEDDEVLMQHARNLDKQHQAKHGRPIGRDALKVELECGTTKATRVAAALKKEREAA